MARQTDIAELQKLLTAIRQMHSWQGELLAQACNVVGQASEDKVSVKKASKTRTTHHKSDKKS